MTSSRPALSSWHFEVVRGRDPGKVFAVGKDAIVVGNAPGDGSGIDLADQEAGAPRKMAGQHARVETSGDSLQIRDLGSPGGTFVNRVRVVPGTVRALEGGDVIQVGAVQLRVVAGPPEPSSHPSPSPTIPFVFTLQSGPVCRSWDDFLAISAQRWDDLRDELTSGRLAGFLAGIGRKDLAPDPTAPGSPDDRLDSWIGLLPTTLPAKPELDVHPRSLSVDSGAGGGSTRRKFQVSNTGYRLLRTSCRVEPQDARWLRIVAQAGHSVTIESSEIVVEIDLPESLGEARSATVVIEGNGGTARVAVSVGPPRSPLADRDLSPGRSPLPSSGLLAGQTAAARFLGWPILAMTLRGLLALGDRILPTAGPSPGLAGAAALFGSLGILGGLLVAIRRGGLGDLPYAGLAGGVIGAMIAAATVALGRVTDPYNGGWLPASAASWGVLAAMAAGASLAIVPPRKPGVSKP